jgi:hypothetical protein
VRRDKIGGRGGIEKGEGKMGRERKGFIRIICKGEDQNKWRFGTTSCIFSASTLIKFTISPTVFVCLDAFCIFLYYNILSVLHLGVKDENGREMETYSEL